jgi:hypothetical protein
MTVPARCGTCRFFVVIQTILDPQTDTKRRIGRCSAGAAEGDRWDDDTSARYEPQATASPA